MNKIKTESHGDINVFGISIPDYVKCDFCGRYHIFAKKRKFLFWSYIIIIKSFDGKKECSSYLNKLNEFLGVGQIKF